MDTALDQVSAHMFVEKWPLLSKFTAKTAPNFCTQKCVKNACLVVHESSSFPRREAE